MPKKYPTHQYHCFLDEAGDTTFYGKRRIPILGQHGVSKVFILGMVSFNDSLHDIRENIRKLETEIEQSDYYKKVPSVVKRVDKGGYYFHAKDDLPEIRKEFYDYIKTLDCNFQAVVGRKIISLFEKKHNGKDPEFYADLLSHLLEKGLNTPHKLVFNIAERANSTSIQNLENGLNKAKSRFKRSYPSKEHSEKIIFSVHKYQNEPLLTVADYLCWTVQRIYEKGETRFYDYTREKIEVVIDLYNDIGVQYYTKENPLTENNKVSPRTP